MKVESPSVGAAFSGRVYEIKIRETRDWDIVELRCKNSQGDHETIEVKATKGTGREWAQKRFYTVPIVEK